MQQRHHLNVAREVAILTWLRALRLPGVVRLLGTSECSNNVYLTFEACEGGDLFTRMRGGGCLGRGEAAICQEVIGPLLSVLADLHSLNIVHRDIK
ncbi:hypothetical protein MNEG_10145 [Monoraphidium neglectum]|uniref:Protein kinase domain-containing protein n=1 Tax=Monoraphidium neglectum TaxID=145388 RepID=A0A0D2MA30_9CHLO|nr:hypothetical protein MNEG_10145 [Monoraphidium neglectum]KIY97816.1 hypothetical protein MNEG_10145 [Monoraphidium neglectum]|eukprot:XP_013896836.1 hypothetical protein MNEG_10145 [Monoraphidium neglectum]